jgi:MoaA/NifB/PqqE/SkfB family radical SAM enzyme
MRVILSSRRAEARSGRFVDFVYFSLFENCNARCNMCTCWIEPRSRPSLADYQALLTKVLSWRPLSIRFTGGEPLLFRALPSLIRQASEQLVRVSLITNGWLLPRRMKELQGANLDELVVSLDGTESIHDEIRGRPGLFDRCKQGLELAMTAGFDIGINTVIQQSNIHCILELWREVEFACPRWWHLIPVRGDESILPTQQQQLAFAHELSKLSEKCRAKGCTLIASPTMFSDHRARCDVPQYIAYVKAATGDVYSCNMLAYAEAPIGNLKRGSADSVISSAIAKTIRNACKNGELPSCDRCDGGSRLMNSVHRENARQWSQRFVKR